MSRISKDRTLLTSLEIDVRIMILNYDRVRENQ